MDHTTALAELLARYGFYQHALVRNQVGHLQLIGSLQDSPISILLDTGAASTVVDLSYCRTEHIATRDTGRLGGGAGGITLAFMHWTVRFCHWMVIPSVRMVFTRSILRM
jgi:hypothetical protein